MPVVVPTNKEVLSYEGLHLFHSGVSNCSMRVRMVLEEKGLEWESHHFNILKKEHITPEYFGINLTGWCQRWFMMAQLSSSLMTLSTTWMMPFLNRR